MDKKFERKNKDQNNNDPSFGKINQQNKVFDLDADTIKEKKEKE